MLLFSGYYKASGVIVLLVLIFLMIFSLLGLNALETQNRKAKSSFNDWKRVGAKTKALQKLMQLEESWVETCSILPMTSLSLKKKPITWWEVNACNDKVENIQYYYVIEDLGKDVCSVIKREEMNVSVLFYRITLLAIPVKLKGAKIILQSTIAKSSEEISSCIDQIRPILLGRQMQREV